MTSIFQCLFLFRILFLLIFVYKKRCTFSRMNVKLIVMLSAFWGTLFFVCLSFLYLKVIVITIAHNLLWNSTSASNNNIWMFYFDSVWAPSPLHFVCVLFPGANAIKAWISDSWCIKRFILIYYNLRKEGIV
jgi:hypothetical protein